MRPFRRDVPTARPWVLSVTSDTRNFAGASEEGGHALVEQREERVVGRTGKVTVERRLEQDRELPDCKRGEPLRVSRVATGLRRPTVHEVVTCGETAGVGHVVVPGQLVRRLDPE